MHLKAQNMAAIFKLLPLDFTPELSQTQKDSLIKYGEFIIPGGDSTNTTKYSIDLSDKDYLFCNYYFTTGQKAFFIIELRRFICADGRQVIVYSKYGGMQKVYSQAELRFFYVQKNVLKEDFNQKILPPEVTVTRFIKKETPDSIKKQIKNAVNDFYDLNPTDKNELSFRISLMYTNDFEKYLTGDKLTFVWNGTRFVRKAITFD
ncbi:MAG: hypothetical protein IT236_09840 [Bacteroidia bacterium]|nr:hypothetical protein [Bacteroidia bacterium]